MIEIRRVFLVGVVLAWGVIAQCAWAAKPVTVEETEQKVFLNNGLVAFELSKTTGEMLALRQIQPDGQARDLAHPGEAMYWDSNTDLKNPPAGQTPVKKGYFRLSDGTAKVKVVHNTPERAEVSVCGGPTTWFQFQVEYRYTMFKGESGFYAQAVITRPTGLAAANFIQTRFVIHAIEKGVFDHWAVGDGKVVPIPTADSVKEVMDATFLLADGSVKTKYMNSVYWAQALTYGTFGKDVGLWMLTASPEYHNGGPVKQGQTVHDRVVLRVLQSQHFGASGVEFADNEEWSKIYGPFFVYVNSGKDGKAMYDDAKKRQQLEAAKWPYKWVDSPYYTKERGAVSGQLRLANGKSTEDAWVILADAGTSWTAQGRGYQFWTKADEKGCFTIPKVIPGRYTLYVSGADQPEDFSKSDISVTADKTNKLGTLTWQPVTHGRQLWQIGTFDRSAGEYRNGDDARNYQMFKRYPTQFPDDVTFTIGQSDIKKDWNYAQWSWYSKNPLWKIRFNQDAVSAGKATLTIGFASAQPAHGKKTDLRVAVNGQEVAAVHLPKTGTAGYRGGVQDSQYNVRDISFDAALLKKGMNEITLGHADAQPFAEQLKALPSPEDEKDTKPGDGYPGQVMYDAIRLELE